MTPQQSVGRHGVTICLTLKKILNIETSEVSWSFHIVNTRYLINFSESSERFLYRATNLIFGNGEVPGMAAEEVIHHLVES